MNMRRKFNSNTHERKEELKLAFPSTKTIQYIA